MFRSIAVNAMRNVEGKEYNVDSIGNGLYLNSGACRDWAYDSGTPFSYTIELRDQGEYGFLLPPDQILATGQELTVGLKAMIEYSIDNDERIESSGGNLRPLWFCLMLLIGLNIF